MTPKERKFCLEYVKEPNPEKAAQRAGYSVSYCRKKAHLILKRPHIITEIQRLRERVNERAEKSATDVVNGFSKIAFTDRVDFLKPDPEHPDQWVYKAPDELNDAQREIVEKVHIHNVFREGKDGQQIFVKQVYGYTFSDKAKALEQMGRHYGLFNDKLKLSAGNQNPFMNATPQQIEALKASWIKTMNDPKLIEGTAVEIKDGNGRG